MSFISTDKIIKLFTEVSQELRKIRYESQVAEFENPIKIVSEGDSWFHFPLMPILTDVINNLVYFPDGSPYAVYSVGNPGDDLVDYVKRINGELTGEIIKALNKENPQFLLISGGGNDILRSDSGGMENIIKPVDTTQLDRTADEYLNDHYKTALLPNMMSVYKDIFDFVKDNHPQCHVLTHSYGYLQPQGDDYIQEPLEKIGFTEANFGSEKKLKMQQVTKSMIDAFHDALFALTENYSNVHLVDCRSVLTSTDWFDEGHPSSQGCGKISDKFSDKILELLGVDELPVLIPKDVDDDGE